MATKLNKKVVRSVKSANHDARKAGELVVSLYMLGNTPMIEVRVKGKRKGYETTIDGLYWMLAKRA